MSNDNPCMNYELIRRLISHDLRHPLQQNMGLYSILPEEMKRDPLLQKMEENNQLMDCFLKTLSEVFEQRQSDRQAQFEQLEKKLHELRRMMREFRRYNDTPRDFSTKHKLDEEKKDKQTGDSTDGKKHGTGD